MQLSELDLRHNIIREVEQVTVGISKCKRLSCLKVEGNPVEGDPKNRLDTSTEALLFCSKMVNLFFVILPESW